MSVKKTAANGNVLYDPTQEAFKLYRSPFYLIAHADFRYHEDVSAVLLKHGVNKGIYRIMTVLREAGPSSISFLADRALIKRNTVSRIIERMAETGLVEAEPDAEDNRVTIVRFTPEGRALLNKLTPAVSRQVKRAMEGISDEAINQLIATLRKIGENLNKLAIE